MTKRSSRRRREFLFSSTGGRSVLPLFFWLALVYNTILYTQKKHLGGPIMYENRREIMQDVFLTYLPARKFKTSRRAGYCF